MKKTLIGMAVGGIVVILANAALNWFDDLALAKRSAAIQTAEPTDWIRFENFTVDGVPPGRVPMANITYEVLKPVSVRIIISPRNVKTGESICSGRLSSIYPEPRSPITISISVATLAGLQSCDFPEGDYALSVTIAPTDLETNVAVKPIIIDHRFKVARQEASTNSR